MILPNKEPSLEKEPSIEISSEFGSIVLPAAEAKAINFRPYQGDSLLKRDNVQFEWTPELREEYIKCSLDPIYFIETYVKIIHVDYGLVPFKLRGYQKQLVRNIHENRRSIIVMARQSGKSTAVVAYMLWYILFNQHKTTALLANKGDTAQEILGKLQLAYVHLPKFLQQGIVAGGWNKQSIILENGSRAFSGATSDNSVRGYAINLLIMDEAAHIERWEEFSKATLPVISSGQTTKQVQISTPKGLNHFYKTWTLAQHYKTPPDKLPKGIRWNGFVPLMVTWREVPGRDEKWREETLAELNFDTDKFAQEYECQFLGSSGTLIAGWKLKELVAKIPEFEKDNLKKYEDPQKNHIYTITVDVSEGKGLDYSTFNVIDVTEMPYKQVCTFRSNLITPTELASLINGAAIAYNNAPVLIEYENLGPEVAESLFMDLEYEYVLNTESAGSRGKKISSGGKHSNMIDRGVKMSKTVKATGCSLLKLLIEQNQLIINDFDTIEELSRFSRKGPSWAAEEGWHDDMVMSLVTFAWLSNQDWFKEYSSQDTLRHLRDFNEKHMESMVLPYVFTAQEENIPFIQPELLKDPDYFLRKAFEEANRPIDPDEDNFLFF